MSDDQVSGHGLRLRLTGLDPVNPLAYLAALGTLRALSTHRPELGVRLSFDAEAAATPVLHGVGDVSAVVAAVLEDAESLEGTPVLSFSYDEAGRWRPDGGIGRSRDLKPSPDSARAFLENTGTIGGEVADIAASYFSDAVTAGDGRIKPTALHFAAGNMQWLKMVGELRDALTPSLVHEALLGPWVGTTKLPSLSWDSTAVRLYALRANDPGPEKRPTIAGANWLAYRALPFFASYVADDGLETTGVVGSWKGGNFAWPLWGVPATVQSVSALSRLDVRRMGTGERRARGVFAVLESRIERTDQGGYGSFSPAGPV
jgi:hypothetical protein